MVLVMFLKYLYLYVCLYLFAIKINANIQFFWLKKIAFLCM